MGRHQRSFQRGLKRSVFFRPFGGLFSFLTDPRLASWGCILPPLRGWSLTVAVVPDGTEASYGYPVWLLCGRFAVELCLPGFAFLNDCGFSLFLARFAAAQLRDPFF
jgi:hypothetical protein